MAAGLPLIVTRTAGTADLVKEGVNGLTLDWADIDTLAGHIRRFALKRELARSMGAASRQLAKSFSWDTAADAYLQLFGKLVDGRPVLEKQSVSHGG